MLMYAHRAAGCSAAVPVCRGFRDHGRAAARHDILGGVLVDGGWRA